MMDAKTMYPGGFHPTSNFMDPTMIHLMPYYQWGGLANTFTIPYTGSPKHLRFLSFFDKWMGKFVYYIPVIFSE